MRSKADNNPTLSAVFLKTSNLIERLGVSKVWETLRSIDTKDELSELKEYIIESCINFYNCKRSDVITTRRIDPDLTHVRSMIIVLMQQHMACSYKIIGMEIKKNSVTVFDAIKDFRCMDEKIKHERIFLENYKILNDQIKKFKLQSNIK